MEMAKKMLDAVSEEQMRSESKKGPQDKLITKALLKRGWTFD